MLDIVYIACQYLEFHCSVLHLPSCLFACSWLPLLVNRENISTLQQQTTANRQMGPQVSQGIDHSLFSPCV